MRADALATGALLAASAGLRAAAGLDPAGSVALAAGVVLAFLPSGRSKLVGLVSAVVLALALAPRGALEAAELAWIFPALAALEAATRPPGSGLPLAGPAAALALVLLAHAAPLPPDAGVASFALAAALALLGFAGATAALRRSGSVEG
ncbi:MAG TPA: hypothetical protein VM889_09985 [Candidatus Thermoplasmatota archaeon]|nr:hypothetical protein [Candidatus Thermoplasmatota archaeon]